MAGVCLLALFAGLLLEVYGLPAETTAENPDVDCLVVNLKYVHCYWNKAGTPGVNYTFYSRFHFEAISECTTYLSENGTNIGCNRPYKDGANRFHIFYTTLVHGEDRFRKELDLKQKVKLDPPTNVTFQMESDSNLWSYWNQTSTPLKCVESELRYRINKKKWDVTRLSGGKQNYCINFPSSTSLYELQVRSKIEKSCGESLFWSEWSEPVYWVSNNSTGAVFVSQQVAHTVLLRKRRYNSGKLEEIIYKDNLERECIEEVCSMEEAREVFENNEKTMEFWVGYIDGDQCKPPPCQNGGECTDGISSYVCWCKPNFSGKNCEIEVYKQCSVNNGGCSHFCVMKAEQTACHCAAGYELGPNKRTCEPTEQFSCGHVNMSSTSVTRSILAPRSSTRSSDRKRNSSHTLLDDYDDDNTTVTYDYYDLSTNDSDTSAACAAGKRSVRSASSSSVDAAEVVLSSGEMSAVTETPSATKQLLSWAFPTVATITEETNTDQRIVGGYDATPGEIPWQVALMSHSASLQRAEPFCGGSLLSEEWVITAAHCLVQASIAKRVFFVRVGEHDVNVSEGPERDHVVAEQHIHYMYVFEKSPYNHDIALLKLATPVELSNHRRPICLGPKDFIENLLRESRRSLVSGWGRIKFLGREASKLQKLEVPYVDRTQCKQSSRDHVTRFMFCAGFQTEQKDSCQGDSGGPHATNYKGTWFLTGIVSWGEECAKDGKYGIYTRVSRYYAWISQTTGIRVN